MSLYLGALYVYPIKSAAGVRCTSVQLTPQGAEHDRTWMVVDASGMLVTLRERPELARVVPSFADGVLRLEAPGMAGLELPLTPEPGPLAPVWMWMQRLTAAVVAAATPWFSAFLGGPYRLVTLAPETVRPLPRHGGTLTFVDGAPLHLVSEASLADLSARLGEPSSEPFTHRFRPNLVVAGAEAFAEDGWKRLRIGPVTVTALGPCERCALVNVNPETAQRGREPLRTLASYRRYGNAVHFGVNVKHEGEGTLRVGDPVEVLG